jgi:hypothetical protein
MPAQNPSSLPIPFSAEGDPRARELLRVWAAHGAQHISIATGVWKDPAAWGITLVDLARHIARSYEQTGGPRAHEALERILEGFHAELRKPTDDPKGNITS